MTLVNVAAKGDEMLPEFPADQKGGLIAPLNQSKTISPLIINRTIFCCCCIHMMLKFWHFSRNQSTCILDKLIERIPISSILFITSKFCSQPQL